MQPTALSEAERRSQSPDGDFFDPEDSREYGWSSAFRSSQSPDGDFFDPEEEPSAMTAAVSAHVTVP